MTTMPYQEHDPKPKEEKWALVPLSLFNNISSSKEDALLVTDLFRRCLVGSQKSSDSSSSRSSSDTQQQQIMVYIPSSRIKGEEEGYFCDEDESSSVLFLDVDSDEHDESAIIILEQPQEGKRPNNSNNNVSLLDQDDMTAPGQQVPTPQSPPTTTTLIRMRTPLRMFPLTIEESWEELEDDLLIILKGRTDHLEHFKHLHHHTVSGVTQPNLLKSLAYLASSPTQPHESIFYVEHVCTVAMFLAIGRVREERKLAMLKTLMLCLSPPEAAWQTHDKVIQGTFAFITRRQEQWEFLEHTETLLLWEIRAVSLRYLDQERERVARVASTGDTAALIISAGAYLVEEGMAKSVSLLSDHLDTAGKYVKGRIKSGEYPLIVDRNAVVAMTYSGAAKRASQEAQDSSRLAVMSIRDASRRGIRMMAQKIEEEKYGETLPPEGVEMVKAAGKVGMAALGATAIVGEAFIETSRAVVYKTSSVTADVVKHRYGTSAGQVVNDAGDTAGNILRTIGNVAMLEKHILAKAVAKDMGKEQVHQETLKAKEAVHRLGSQASTMMKQTLGISMGGDMTRRIAAKSAVVKKETTSFDNNKSSQHAVGVVSQTMTAPQPHGNATAGLSMRGANTLRTHHFGINETPEKKGEKSEKSKFESSTSHDIESSERLQVKTQTATDISTCHDKTRQRIESYESKEETSSKTSEYSELNVRKSLSLGEVDAGTLQILMKANKSAEQKPLQALQWVSQSSHEILVPESLEKLNRLSTGSSGSSTTQTASLTTESFSRRDSTSTIASVTSSAFIGADKILSRGNTVTYRRR